MRGHVGGEKRLARLVSEKDENVMSCWRWCVENAMPCWW